jgi:hypothetical protein
MLLWWKTQRARSTRIKESWPTIGGPCITMTSCKLGLILCTVGFRSDSSRALAQQLDLLVAVV